MSRPHVWPDDATAAAPVVVARQPILDRTENVIGFGFPSAPIGSARATASVLQSFADVGSTGWSARSRRT
jgi:hypothetical protein